LHCSWYEKNISFIALCSRNHEVATVKNQEMPLVWGLIGKSISDGNLEANSSISDNNTVLSG